MERRPGGSASVKRNCWRVSFWIALFALSCVIESRPARASLSLPLPRTATVTIRYAAPDISPGRLMNANVAFREMLAFFGNTPFTPGVDYSFNHNVLGNSLPSSKGYIATPGGYGEGINDAASALNTLVHKALFMDKNSVLRPIFEQVHAVPLRNNATFGDFAIGIYLAGTGSQDYVWRLNPAYDGPTPAISGQFDTANNVITLTVRYTDQSVLPDDPKAKRAILTDSLRAVIEA